jgi:predicted TPR repeat methyltransferase
MLSVRGSSGDILADRRYAYALDLLREGDFPAAASLFEQAIERAPKFMPAWRELSRARIGAGDHAGAVEALKICLDLDPSDESGASLELARLEDKAIDGAPPAYVAALFDAYAAAFDAALIDRLQYRTPGKLAALIRSIKPPPYPRVIDLGCGTGLMGAALGGETRWLKGVDLSAEMIAAASRRNIYAALEQTGLVQALREQQASYDLIVASDVFNYIGDLGPVIEAAAARLAPLGLLAFSVEKGSPDRDYAVQESLRFRHSESYLRRLAARFDLQTLAIEPSVLRLDAATPVEGLLVVMSRA